MKIKNTMTKKVVFCRTFEKVQAAYAIMREMGTRHMPVLEGKKLVGILSDRDILLAAQLNDKGVLQFGDLKCGDIMTKDVIVTSPDISVNLSVDLLLKYKIDSLPVVNEDRELLGIVTTTDLLLLLKTVEEEFVHEPLPFSFELRDVPSVQLFS